MGLRVNKRCGQRLRIGRHEVGIEALRAKPARVMLSVGRSARWYDEGARLVLDAEVSIEVVRVEGHKVKLHIDAPKKVRVDTLAPSGAPVREDDIHKAILKEARRRRLLVVHTPNGGPRTERTGRAMKLLGTQAGMPDLMIYTRPIDEAPGVALEVKTPEGRVSAEQKEMLAQLEACGWHAHVVRSLDEAIGVFDALYGAG